MIFHWSLWYVLLCDKHVILTSPWQIHDNHTIQSARNELITWECIFKMHRQILTYLIVSLTPYLNWSCTWSIWAVIVFFCWFCHWSLLLQWCFHSVSPHDMSKRMFTASLLILTHNFVAVSVLLSTSSLVILFI